MTTSQGYIFDPALELEEYDRFAQNHQYCNILQSAPWPEIKSEWVPLRVGVRNEQGDLIGAGQVLRRKIVGKLSFWYLAHGPLLDFYQEGLLEFFLDKLARYARKNHCLFLRIHPPIPIRTGSIADFREGAPNTEYALDELTERFAKQGYVKKEVSSEMGDTIQPRFQAIIIKDEWEEPPRGRIRYNLRQAERYHVKTSSSQNLKVDDQLDEFARLIKLTEERQGIRLRDRSYFSKIMKAFGKDAIILLADFDLDSAEETSQKTREEISQEMEACQEKSPRKYKQLEEQLISRNKDQAFYQTLRSELESQGKLEAGKTYHPSGVLAIRYGLAADMPYAGSDEMFSRLPAVWKLYVEGIRWAFEAGCERYNLGGLEGSFDDGLTVFKSHFNPRIEETAGEYDYPCKPLLYKLIRKITNI